MTWKFYFYDMQILLLWHAYLTCKISCIPAIVYPYVPVEKLIFVFSHNLMEKNLNTFPSGSLGA